MEGGRVAVRRERAPVSTESHSGSPEGLAALVADRADAASFKHVVLMTAAKSASEPSLASMYASVISVACNDEQGLCRFYYNPASPSTAGRPASTCRWPVRTVATRR
jgi:hypothetical protein